MCRALAPPNRGAEDTKVKVTVLALIVMLAGCATRPVADTDARAIPADQVIDSTYLSEAPGTGRVTVKRDSGFLSGGCVARLFVDAKPVADLRRSEKVVL